MQALHLLLQLLDLLRQMARLGFERLRRLLPIGGVELLEIAGDALLNLHHAPIHLGAGEVPVTIVHRLELAAVDRHAGLREQAHRAAQRDEARAHFADGKAIVFAEVRNRLVVGNEAAGQPHHLHIAASLTLKPPTRLNPVEIAVNVQLQQHRWMIRRPAGYLRLHPPEPKLGKIKCVGEDVDHPNRIVLPDPVFQAFREECVLSAIRPLNEAPHLTLPQIARESYRQNQILQGVFTQPRSGPEELDLSKSRRLYTRTCCKTRWFLSVRLGRVLAICLSRSPVEGVAASTHRLTQRLRWASGCERWWSAAEQLDESPQVLRRCGE